MDNVQLTMKESAARIDFKIFAGGEIIIIHYQLHN